jgi:hypothetical protein
MLYILSVRFPSNIENVQFTGNAFSGGTYDYLSPVEQRIGQLVVVPVYSRNGRLRLAEVVDSIQIDENCERIGKLRYIIDIVDTVAFERFEQERIDRVRALRMIEQAYEKQHHADMFAAVSGNMPAEQREFVRRALRLPPSLPVSGDADTDATPGASTLHDAGNVSGP